MSTYPLPTHPAPTLEDLQSGDLLFLKKPNDRVIANVPGAQLFASTSVFGARSAMYKGRDLEETLDDLNLTASHVAMAFEENKKWYVMESGCTDYAHYRVCISPYEDAGDAARSAAQKRGWVARRLALGQCVWSARHKGLKPEQVPMIVDHCKNFLSVPYGILEPGMMQNPDRLYCSELLRNGFTSVGLKFDDNQNWGWMVRQLSQSTGMVDWILNLVLRNTPFPLLSPKMIYADPRMEQIFHPGPKGAELSYL